ncbi:SRPBCC domain-containing protein [Mesorhizobium sp. CC13]|uniref:SRPBCC family protein n=1 Tax=Mesorhizobium sp. CC13 TaxID=3029194 RepID=UPI0032655A04
MTDILVADEKCDAIVVECELEAEPEKVWRALTVPELVSAWLDVPAADDVAADTTGPVYRIVEALPFSRVRYAWNDDSAGEPDGFVTFDLAAQPGGGTWLRLTHSAEIGRRPAGAAANSNSPPVMARAA